METESYDYVLPDDKKTFVTKFVGEAYPTHAELLAAQGDVISAESLATLNDMGCRVDPDVVAVLSGVYADIEMQRRNPSEKATYLYAALVSGSIGCVGFGVASAFEGDIDHAYSSFYTAVGLYTSAYMLNRLDDNTHAARMNEWLTDHWPPVYSPAGLKRAELEGYLRGRIQGTLEHIKRVSEQKEDEEVRPDLEIPLLVFNVATILDAAQYRFLSREELTTLQTVKNAFSKGYIDLYYINFSDPEIQMIDLLVHEYETGTYPIDFQFEMPEQVA
ncbi:hypothetical protein KAZ66_03845 [Candidatus Woesebacteria bacterium]|nr:hypothetical protein [Candidatus Woesebacteria bacterium]